METALLKKRRRVPFLQRKIEARHTGDVNKLTDLLQKIEDSQVRDETKGFRFKCHVYSLSAQRHMSGMYAPKTLIRYIKNGHTDLGVWFFANPMEEKTVQAPWGWKKTWVAKVKRNFVIDLDARCGMKSIEEVIAHFTKMGVPLPGMITQTGPQNFHLLIYGKTNQWVRILDRVALACKLASIDMKSAPDMQHVRLALQDKGFDYNYLCQDPGMHKIRLGGSINPNHINDKNEPFITKSWINPDAHPELAIISDNPLKGKPRKKKEKKKEYIWKSKVEPLRKILVPVIGRRYALKYAKYLCKNMNFLRQGVLGITQTKLAEEIGISQRAVSKHLKRMITSGLLFTDHEYVFSSKKGEGRCKVYKLGIVLLNKLFDGYVLHEILDLTKSYDTDGETNHRLLRDVKAYLYLGVDDDRIKKICLLKMEARPAHKKRTASDVQNVIDFHRSRLAFPQNGCRLNVDEHLQEIAAR